MQHKYLFFNPQLILYSAVERGKDRFVVIDHFHTWVVLLPPSHPYYSGLLAQQRPTRHSSVGLKTKVGLVSTLPQRHFPQQTIYSGKRWGLGAEYPNSSVLPFWLLIVTLFRARSRNTDSIHSGDPTYTRKTYTAKKWVRRLKDLSFRGKSEILSCSWHLVPKI
jgi:hypothetical protein